MSENSTEQQENDNIDDEELILSDLFPHESLTYTQQEENDNDESNQANTTLSTIHEGTQSPMSPQHAFHIAMEQSSLLHPHDLANNNDDSSSTTTLDLLGEEQHLINTGQHTPFNNTNNNNTNTLTPSSTISKPTTPFLRTILKPPTEIKTIHQEYLNLQKQTNNNSSDDPVQAVHEDIESAFVTSHKSSRCTTGNVSFAQTPIFVNNNNDNNNNEPQISNNSFSQNNLHGSQMGQIDNSIYDQSNTSQSIPNDGNNNNNFGNNNNNEQHFQKNHYNIINNKQTTIVESNAIINNNNDNELNEEYDSHRYHLSNYQHHHNSTTSNKMLNTKAMRLEPIRSLLRPEELLGAWRSTAISANDCIASILYIAGPLVAISGIYSLIPLFLTIFVIYLYRFIYVESITALKSNGGLYSVFLNVQSKKTAAFVSVCVLLSYISTSVVSAVESVHYFRYVYNFDESYISTAVVGVLSFFAILSIVGIGESSKVALFLFALHIITLTIISLFAFGQVITQLLTFGYLPALIKNIQYTPMQFPVIAAETQQISTFHTLRQIAMPITTRIFLGISSTFLGYSGFETSSSFVRQQKPGVFPKTLHRMWLFSSIFNVLIITSILLLVDIQYVVDHQIEATIVSHLAHVVGGKTLQILTSIDSALVLSASVLTAYTGNVGVMSRLVVDRNLPQFLLAQNKWRNTYHYIVISFFILCVSMFFLLHGDIAPLNQCYSLSFLSVMLFFGIGLILLKFKRSSLLDRVFQTEQIQQEQQQQQQQQNDNNQNTKISTTTKTTKPMSIATVMLASFGIVLAMMSVIARDSAVLEIFSIYYIIGAFSIGIMLYRADVTGVICKLLLYLLVGNSTYLNNQKMLLKSLLISNNNNNNNNNNNTSLNSSQQQQQQQQPLTTKQIQQQIALRYHLKQIYKYKPFISPLMQRILLQNKLAKHNFDEYQQQYQQQQQQIEDTTSTAKETTPLLTTSNASNYMNDNSIHQQQQQQQPTFKPYYKRYEKRTNRKQQQQQQQQYNGQIQHINPTTATTTMNSNTQLSTTLFSPTVPSQGSSLLFNNNNNNNNNPHIAKTGSTTSINTNTAAITNPNFISPLSSSVSSLTNTTNDFRFSHYCSSDHHRSSQHDNIIVDVDENVIVAKSPTYHYRQQQSGMGLFCDNDDCTSASSSDSDDTSVSDDDVELLATLIQNNSNNNNHNKHLSTTQLPSSSSSSSRWINDKNNNKVITKAATSTNKEQQQMMMVVPGINKRLSTGTRIGTSSINKKGGGSIITNNNNLKGKENNKIKKQKQCKYGSINDQDDDDDDDNNNNGNDDDDEDDILNEEQHNLLIPHHYQIQQKQQQQLTISSPPSLTLYQSILLYLYEKMYKLDQDINHLTIGFFTRHGNLKELNKAIQYILNNEDCNNLFIIHCFTNIKDIPSTFYRNVLILQQQYGDQVNIEPLLVNSEFTPALVAYLSIKTMIPRNLFFITTPTMNFKYVLEDFGGVRVILQ